MSTQQGPQQVAEYRGATREEALQAFAMDSPNAAAHGFSPVSQEWGEDGVLRVTYQQTAPQRPPMLVRVYMAPQPQIAAQLYAQDVPAMAGAGYVPMAQSWGGGGANLAAVATFGIAGMGVQNAGALTVTYQFAPEQTGPPRHEVPPIPVYGQLPAGWGAKR